VAVSLQEKAVPIAAKMISGPRHWSKLREWLGPDSMPPG